MVAYSPEHCLVEKELRLRVTVAQLIKTIIRKSYNFYFSISGNSMMGQEGVLSIVFKDRRLATFIFLSVITLICLSRISNEQTNWKFVLQHIQRGYIDYATVSETLFENVTFPRQTHVEMMLDRLCRQENSYSKKFVTSAKYSRIVGVKNGQNDGDVVVDIAAYSVKNTPKDIGGDLIIVWGVEKHGSGRVAGVVTDHGNGNYTGTIQVPWTGLTEIHVKLGAILENTCLRIMAMEKYGNAVFAMKNGWGIRGVFQKRQIKDITPCGGNPIIYGYEKLCNFTKRNDGLSWFCGHPKRLTCDDIYSFGCGAFNTNAAPPEEKVVIPSVEEFKSKPVINVSHVKIVQVETCDKKRPIESWKAFKQGSSGFWKNGSWDNRVCFSSVEHSIESYRTCLRGKLLVFFGESTIRQYAEYFLKNVMEISLTNLKDAKGINRSYHKRLIYENYGIYLKYMKHAMPFHNLDFSSNGITTLMTELDNLGRSDIPDDQMFIVIGYNAHFQAYPVYVYRDRLKKLAESLRAFLKLKPRAKLFYKNPNFSFDDTRWFDNHLARIYMEINEQELSDLKDRVTLLDVWSISLAHNENKLHPGGNCMLSQIQQLMAYIC